MRTMIQYTAKVLSAGLLSIGILCGCAQTETENILPAGDDGNAGETVALSIGVVSTPEYLPETDGTAATRSGKPLLAEWVKVNSFSATRSAEEYEGPAIAAMELVEDSVSSTPQTRGMMTTGYYFRLIAFQKSGNDYVFHSVADYTVNDENTPELQQGTMNLTSATYRFLAYSFNSADAMGTLPASYTWNSTSVTIPDLSTDFLTYDSQDQALNAGAFSLSIRFTHQLCRLTVKILATGFSSNTFSNCTGVFIKEGGDSSSWTVGASGIEPNTNNTAAFNIDDNNTTTSTRLVPFADARPITVHFGTLTVGGKVADNTEITSSQSVQLLAGRSYTMTVQLKALGIQVPAADINLGGSGCTEQDKNDLAMLTWADGNLKSTEQTNLVWTTPTDYGYYYTWNSTYTGDTSSTGIDPCTKVDASIYGTGWRTPSKNELEKLTRCTDGVIVTSPPTGGMWFMNSSTGLFLPAASYNSDGSGTVDNNASGMEVSYWSSELSSEMSGGDYAYTLLYNPMQSGLSNGLIRIGRSVRCVKGDKQ